MRHTYSLLFAALLALTPARATTFTLDGGGALWGAPDATVGWGFTLTSTIIDDNGSYVPWLLVNSVDFVPNPGQFPVGIFTPYMTVSPNSSIVIGPDGGNGEVNPWTQAFNSALLTGVGEVHINSFQALGDQVQGRIVVSYDIYRKSPNDPTFDPITDTVLVGQQLFADASVTVADSAPSPTPEPVLSGVLGVALLAVVRMSRRKSLA